MCSSRRAPTPRSTRRAQARRVHPPTAQPAPGTSDHSSTSTCSPGPAPAQPVRRPALISVLASLRRRLERRTRPAAAQGSAAPALHGLSARFPARLGASDSRILRAFLQRYKRLVRSSTRLARGLGSGSSPSTTTTSRSSARWDGNRRCATCASSAVSPVSTRRSAPRNRGLSPVRPEQGGSEQGARSSRGGGGTRSRDSWTIHAAKGLEFKVVIVADAFATSGPARPDKIVALSDGRFGFRMVHPTRGFRREPVFDWDEVKEAAGDQDRAERLRLYDVAMTRAIDRLIVSGVIYLRAHVRTHDADRLVAPAGSTLQEAIAEADDTPLEVERADARFVVYRRLGMAPSSPPPPRPLVEPDDAESRTPVGSLGEAPGWPIPRLGIVLPSLSDISLLLRCTTCDGSRTARSRCSSASSYRYYAERVLGLPPRVPERSTDGELGVTRGLDGGRRRSPSASRARSARRPGRPCLATCSMTWSAAGTRT